jgi:cytosine/adenosine deaminase-related metal-dependent hydrolase
VRVVSADWVLPVEGEPIEDGAVRWEDGRIVAVGPASELGHGERFEESAIVPGLVNAHTHLEYAVYAGFGDGLAFAPWLRLHIERKARLDFDDMVAIARLGAAECLHAGITTVADYSFAGATAVACAELGLRATVYLEVFGADGDDARRQYEEKRVRIDGGAGGVRLGVSPHAPYSCSVDVYAACADLGVPVGTHLAESVAEDEWLRHGAGPMAPLRHILVDPPGETGIRLLAGQGLLGGDLVAAHCVHVDEEEIALLAAADVGIVHCPRSNALLGCGVAPLAELRAACRRVGLGTDSPASTPSLDPFDELRAALYAARAREGRPDALSGSEALELATLGSARALRLEHEVGSLVPGKRADLAVVSLAGSPYLPWEDPATAVVFGGSPERVLLTVVDGDVCYRQGETECPELIAGGRRARARMTAASSSGTRAPT